MTAHPGPLSPASTGYGTVAGAAAPQRAPFDPLRFCVFTTIGLIAWILGAAAVIVTFSGLGLLAYGKAIRGGLRQSRCVLRRPLLVMCYLGAAFLFGAGLLVRRWIG